MKHAEWGHTHGMWEVNGLLFLSGVRRVTDRSIPEHSGLSFLIRTLEGVGKHAFARLVYSGVWYSELSIWVVWGGWGACEIAGGGVLGERVWVHVHVWGASACLWGPWVAGVLARATKLHFVCARMRVCVCVCARELKGVCVCT